jgi:hypothetical protein
MSIAQNPLTGQMRNSMANFNTYVHRGQNVVSSKAFNRKDKNSDLQKAQRFSFKLMSDVWGSLGGYGESGFPVRPEKLSPYNYFMSLNLPNAIDNSGDVPMINYGLLQIAKGTCPAVNVSSSILSETALTLNCLSNIDFPVAAAEDVVITLAKTKTGALYASRQARGSESICTINLAMPNVVKENIEFVYVFVTTADGKKASNSVYVTN